MRDETRTVIEELRRRRAELLQELRAEPSGLDWCDHHTQIADDVLRALYQDLTKQFDELPPLAVVATGGTGRRELAPSSDVDITIVPFDEAHPNLDAAIKTLFHDVHEAFGSILGIEVGYECRFIGDVPGLDGRTRTGLLDARLVVGSRQAFDALMREYWETFPVAEFLIDKLDERRRQMARHNDTPYAVEPELKEGAGGLRSFQCANWMGAAIGERMTRPTAPYDAVLQARNLLHLVAGKRQDQLTRTLGTKVAELTGADPLSYGSDLAANLRALHEEYLRATEQLHEARFPLGSGAVALRGEIRIAPGASASEASLGVALATKLGLRVSEMQAAATKEVSGPEALVAICSGEGTIRNMERCGVLDVLLPELARCRTLMPPDTSHAFTVFEHTLRVVRLLDSISPDSFYGEVKSKVRDLGALYLAALLHDTGKIDAIRMHEAVGEEIARTVSKRWRLPEATVEAVAWLVREHLSLDRFTRMRDVMHPETALEFAKLVKTPERLAMLALLTWADASAVSPESWTPVQDMFLRELYVRTQAALETKLEPETDPVQYRRRILRRLKSEQAPEQQLAAFVDSMPAHYLLSTDPEQVGEHFRYAERALQGQPTVELFQRPDFSAMEVTVCCADSPGLLNRILGVIYALDFSLVGIRASTTRSEHPVALDVFTITFGNRPIPQTSASHLSAALYQVLRGEAQVADLMRRARKDPERRQEIYRYTYKEGAPGILEVRAPQGRGMAYRISRVISEQGWNIIAARVGQWAGSGAAAFYVLGHDLRAIPSSDVERVFGMQKV